VCYIGLDVHKKLVVHFSNTADGAVVEEGWIAATAMSLLRRSDCQNQTER
jgi:hypothetical protein